MKIVLTGSIGNIGRKLVTELVGKDHLVSVISSSEARAADIIQLGAKPLIGTMQDVSFLTAAFTDADAVYLMETMEAVGDMFDTSIDFIGDITAIGANYQQAVRNSGVKNVIHLSSVGAHTDEGTGILRFHYQVEQLLRQLPDNVNIKFIRPVGFYINMFSFIHSIKSEGAIVSNYGGDRKEPWVSPSDIADVIVEELEKPFAGRTVRYVASDEVSPNEVARSLGQAIGKPGLQWKEISDEALLDKWLNIGFNPQVARGFVELQAGQRSGQLYEDYNLHRPELGKVKLADFAKAFAEAYKED